MELVGHSDREVRLALLGNPSLTERVLTELTGDEDAGIAGTASERLEDHMVLQGRTEVRPSWGESTTASLLLEEGDGADATGSAVESTSRLVDQSVRGQGPEAAGRASPPSAEPSEGHDLERDQSARHPSPDTWHPQGLDLAEWEPAGVGGHVDEPEVHNAVGELPKHVAEVDSDDNIVLRGSDDVIAESTSGLPDGANGTYLSQLGMFSAGEDDPSNVAGAPIAPVQMPAGPTQFDRALALAAELCASHRGWEDAVDLLATVFDQVSIAPTRDAIERELDEGLTPDELALAVQLRDYWSQSDRFSSAWTYTRRGWWLRPRFINLSWPLSLKIVRGYEGVPDFEEVVLGLERLYDHWRGTVPYEEQYSFLDYLYALTSNASSALEWSVLLA